MTKEFLHDKKGLVIDSYGQGNAVVDLIKSYGGEAELIVLGANDIDEAMFGEGLSFVIVHNYTFKDKDVLLKARKQGIPILLIKRTIIPEQHEEYYEKMYNELLENGVTIEETVEDIEQLRYRYRMAAIYLNKQFNKI